MAPVVVLLAACSSTPEASNPGQLASGWLADLRDDNDPKAKILIGMPPGGPTDFDLERFTKRVDRLPLLRDHERVEWTSLEWSEPDYWREGDPIGSTFIRGIQYLDRTATLCGDLVRGEERAEICTGVRRGKLYNVKVGGRHLIPRHNYHVVPAPPPLDEPPSMRDIAIDWTPLFDGYGVAVRGEIEITGDYGWRLETLCHEGDRYYWHATIGDRSGARGWTPAQFQSAVGPNLPDQCEVTLRISQQQTRLQTWCLVGAETFTVGACPDQPEPEPTGPDQVTVDEVSMTMAGRGTTVHYTVHPNVPMPAPGPPEWAAVYTDVECAEGELERHARPLVDRDHRVGVHRRVGSVLIEENDRDLVPPCSVWLRFARDDDYDRVEHELYEGCFDGTELTEGACD